MSFMNKFRDLHGSSPPKRGKAAPNHDSHLSFLTKQPVSSFDPNSIPKESIIDLVSQESPPGTQGPPSAQPPKRKRTDDAEGEPSSPPKKTRPDETLTASKRRACQVIDAIDGYENAEEVYAVLEQMMAKKEKLRQASSSSQLAPSEIVEDTPPTSDVAIDLGSTRYVPSREDERLAAQWVNPKNRNCMKCVVARFAGRLGAGKILVNKPMNNDSPFCQLHNPGNYLAYKSFRRRLQFPTTGATCFRCGGSTMWLHDQGCKGDLREIGRSLRYSVYRQDSALN
ncbi:hypothetical protein TWF281_010573 [Arthrobotrys megalospora]